MKTSLIILILFIGTKQSLAQQRLASEKPVESFYSKSTREKLKLQHTDGQPAARHARQPLPSVQVAQRPMVPARIQPVKQQPKRKATGGKEKLASEKPVLLPNVHVKKGAGSALPS